MGEPALGSSDVTVLKGESRVIARLELENRMSIAIHESSLPVSIGRGNDCDISIPDSHISRHHCEVSSVNGVLCLRDMSANGTFVGDRRVTDESVTIPESCRINLGGSVNLTLMPEQANRDSVSKRRKKNGRYEAKKLTADPRSERLSDDQRSAPDRRAEDRRQFSERRSNVVRVDFDRRDVERRADERRKLIRRIASN